jgi:hypothetical protein
METINEKLHAATNLYNVLIAADAHLRQYLSEPPTLPKHANLTADDIFTFSFKLNLFKYDATSAYLALNQHSNYSAIVIAYKHFMLFSQLYDELVSLIPQAILDDVYNAFLLHPDASLLIAFLKQSDNSTKVNEIAERAKNSIFQLYGFGDTHGITEDAEFPNIQPRYVIISQFDTFKNIMSQLAIEASSIEELSAAYTVVIVDKTFNPIDYDYSKISAEIKTEGLTTDLINMFSTFRKINIEKSQMVQIFGMVRINIIKAKSKLQEPKILYLERAGNEFRIIRPMVKLTGDLSGDITGDFTGDFTAPPSQRIIGYALASSAILKSKIGYKIKISENILDLKSDIGIIRAGAINAISKDVNEQAKKLLAKATEAAGAAGARQQELTNKEIFDIFQEAIFSETSVLAMQVALRNSFIENFGDSAIFMSLFAADFIEIRKGYKRKVSDVYNEKLRKVSTNKSGIELMSVLMLEFEKELPEILKGVIPQNQNPFLLSSQMQLYLNDVKALVH